MNLDSARSFALDFLINYVDRAYTYHNLPHTLDVFQTVSMLALYENVNKKEMVLLQTAALYHDLGIHINYYNSVEESLKIVKNSLPDFDFRRSEIKAICKIIEEATGEKTNKTKSGQLLCDADYDYLGREDFLNVSGLLRKEWEYIGFKRAYDKDWYLYQKEFLVKHFYHTASSKKLRDEGKKNNIKKLEEIINQYN